jgi:glycosyltransferase involved in cell wall biosynthesis
MVDVVIPAFNEEAHIDRCLDTVFGQDHPAERMRVWVVDAGSTDRTAEVVRARPEPQLALVTGRGRLNAGQALNVGIAAGSADLIVRVDAHTYLAPGYISGAAALMEELGPRLALVSGQPTQLGETRFGEGAVRARRSPFGVGSGSIYADRRTRAYVDTVQGGMYRRAALEAVGGFGTTFLTGEDEECNWRLRKAGYDILLDTGLEFAYTTRSSWWALFRQHRNYGASRASVVTRHPGYLRPRHLVPSAFVTSVIGLGMASVVSRRARWALATTLAAYGTGVAAAGRAAARDDPSLAPHVAAAFTAMHTGYGLGLIIGFSSIAAGALGVSTPRSAVVSR